MCPFTAAVQFPRLRATALEEHDYFERYGSGWHVVGVGDVAKADDCKR
jgi:hypothetical protein